MGNNQIWRVWIQRNTASWSPWGNPKQAHRGKPDHEAWIPFLTLVALTLLIIAAGVLG